MLRIIAKILKALNSEAAPGQISLAVVLAMVVGFTPLLSLHNLIILFILLTLRINLSAFILSLAFFSGLAFALDPLFHAAGLKVLTLESLEGAWTVMYNSNLMRIERFNNTIVMGSLLISLALAIPLYLLLNLAIRRYRQDVLEWVKKSRIARAITASRFYRVYQTVKGFGADG